MTLRHCWISLIAVAWGCSQGTPLAVDPVASTQTVPAQAESPAALRNESLDTIKTPPLAETNPRTERCAMLSHERVSDFSGLKIHLQEAGHAEWLYLPLVKLEQRRDLQDKPLLITGYVGRSGMDLVCSRLQAAGFTALSFVEETSLLTEVDSYQSLLLLENSLPKVAVISTEEEKALLESLGTHIRLVNVNELSDPLISALLQVKTRDECQDIFVTRSTWQARTAAAPKHQLSNQCHVVVMPDTALIKAELDRQRTANIKRNMPLEKYKCET